MLYLDYAKPMKDGYILNFFADSVDDIEEVSNGKRFITMNGTDYGVPLASSTIVITSPDKERKTFILNDAGKWEESGALRAWTATVIGLGSRNPKDVKFVKTDNFPTSWEEVTVDSDVFIKFPKIYRKINRVEPDPVYKCPQITSFTISNFKIDDDYKPYPCFVDENGQELDYILVGKYMSKSSTVCNSVRDGDPAMQTIATGRTNARAKGAGYQLIDWRIQRLWQDLMICSMETLDPDPETMAEADILGIYWGGGIQYFDGAVGKVDGKYLCSNFPSKYIDNPTEDSDGYVATSYTATGVPGGAISVLGYDNAEGMEFFNFAGGESGASGYDEYYCCEFRAFYNVTYGPMYAQPTSTETPKSFGIFYTYMFDTGEWGEETPVRLCYRPIAG